MRWQVEMTPIGKTEAQSAVVEAESWQKALQGARSLRGENGPMSGFSIELLEHGYRAVDPMARLIYTVKRAADDAPIASTIVNVNVGTSGGAAKSSGTNPGIAAAPKPVETSPAADATTAKKPDSGSVATATPAAGSGSPVASAAVSPSSPPRPSPQASPHTSSPAVNASLKQTLAFGLPGAAMEILAAKLAPVPPAPIAATIPTAATTEPILPVAAPSAPAVTQSPHAPQNVLSAADSTLMGMAVSDDAATYIDKGTHHDGMAQPPSLSDVPATQIIFKREEDPTPHAPLSYREYVYAVASGTTEDDAEGVLLAQFDLVKKALETSRAGKLVNLAVFDVVFKGKPPALPLATLAWKDWKGEPTIAFPRRTPKGRAAPAYQAAVHPPQPQMMQTALMHAQTVAALPMQPQAQPQPPSQGGAQPLAAPVHAGSSPSSAAPNKPASIPPPPAAMFQDPAANLPSAASTAAFPMSANPAQNPVHPQNHAPAPAGGTMAFPAPAPAGAHAPGSALVPAPANATAAVPSAAVGFPAPVAIPFPAAAPSPVAHTSLAPDPTPGPGPTERPSQAGRAPVPRGRHKGDELITALFEAMHDLHFLRDAIEGGHFCISLALDTLPSTAGIVHMYDIDKREFVVAVTAGKGAEKLLTRRHPESDPLLSKAMRKRRAIVVADATNEEGASNERYAIFGGAKSVIVAPVLYGGRFIGALELINPQDGDPFSEGEGNALNYIAEQYAEFVSQHGVVIDNEAISMRPGALRAR